MPSEPNPGPAHCRGPRPSVTALPGSVRLRARIPCVPKAQMTGRDAVTGSGVRGQGTVRLRAYSVSRARIEAATLVKA